MFRALPVLANFPNERRAPENRPLGATGPGGGGAGRDLAGAASWSPCGGVPMGGVGGTSASGTQGGTIGTPPPGPLLDEDVPIFPPRLDRVLHRFRDF